MASKAEQMALQTLDLWSLVRGRPQIDPNDLAEAVIEQIADEPHDYRTRLLIRDSVNALRHHWGDGRVDRWLADCPTRDKIEAICQEEFERVGFPSIMKRLMEKTDPETIEQYFRELSQRARVKMRIPVGGSASLISRGLLVRHTDDIDIVDEVPRELREQHDLLNELQQRYGLSLTHFQQHYLPSGWSSRLEFHHSYGDLQIDFVDPLDIFLGKLTSKRIKDFDDLRMLARQFDKSIIVQRMNETMQSTLADETLKQQARQNWQVLYGEDLPL
jgi:hypothetical protein